MSFKCRVQRWAAGCELSTALGNDRCAWSKVCDQEPRYNGSRHPKIDSPIGDTLDFGLRESDRRPHPTAASGAPALHPDQPDKKNQADNKTQLHFPSHCHRVYHRVRRFTIADEGVKEHDRADPMNASIQPSKGTEQAN